MQCRSSGRGSNPHLELMRLARSPFPPPRRSAWLESNQRSPAPRAGGVAISPTGRRLHPIRQTTDGGTKVSMCVRWVVTNQCCPCHSPTLRPWITARRVQALAESYVEGCWSPSLICVSRLQAGQSSPPLRDGVTRLPTHAEGLSLSGGASIGVRAFQAEHHLLDFTLTVLGTKKATHLGRPRLACYARRSSACTSQRGPNTPAGGADCADPDTAKPRRHWPLRRRTCVCWRSWAFGLDSSCDEAG